MADYNTQSQNNQMTPEEAKASLGQATALVDQFLMQQNPQMEQQGMSTNQPGEQSQQMDQGEEMSKFKEEIINAVREGVGGIKKMVEEALNEEDTKEDDGKED